MAGRFLPKRSRHDIADLYSFVALAGGYHSQQPQNTEAFSDLIKVWQQYRRLPMAQLDIDKNDSLNVRAIKKICRLKIAHQFDEAWIESFLQSIGMNFKRRNFRTMEDTLRYMYGSAEVIGLMAAKILGLPKRAMHAASMQARAIQYMHFLRDMADDQDQNRSYFPLDELQKYNLRSLKKSTLTTQPADFAVFVRAQLRFYNQWQRIADRGFSHIPKRSRAAILLLIDSYHWTATQIEKDPSLIWHKKLKPSRARLLISGAVHALD